MKASTKSIAPLRHSLYRGTCARVAKRLNVSISIVARVAKGRSISKRITEELAREEKRIERELARRNGRAA